MGTDGGVNARERRIVMEVASRTRPLVLRNWRRDSCIPATRIAVLALRELGVRAAPVPCEALVYNAAYVARTTAEGRMPHDVAEAEVWWQEDRAWGIGIGCRELSEPAEGAWNGHLVALIDGRTLLDLAIDQADRPARDISIEDPVLADVPREWRHGDLRFHVPHDGAHVFYKATPDNTGYLTAPDWTRLERHRPVVRQLVTAIARQAA